MQKESEMDGGREGEWGFQVRGVSLDTCLSHRNRSCPTRVRHVSGPLPDGLGFGPAAAPPAVEGGPASDDGTVCRMVNGLFRVRDKRML